MAELARTPLYDAHVRLDAKMVDFGGWNMPLQYPTGILAEHRAVRESVGIFDVSHMGEIDFHGPGALEAVQKLVTNDVAKLQDDRALYTVACRDHGGIVDDCIVYRFGPEYYRIVVNASNIAKDEAFFREHAGELCDIVDRSAETALLAVQGPKAVALVAELAGRHLADVPGFGLGRGRCAGIDIVTARTGYTGEDGFEIFVAAADAPAVWDAIVRAGATPAGLGARDTLRLEARLCLYGNDIDETTNPFEAGLAWTVKLDKGVDFVGRKALVDLKQRITRRLIGFRVLDRGIVRAGADVVDEAGGVVGRVTSGSAAPTVGGGIGMAYVPAGSSEPGTVIALSQRGKTLKGEVVKGPFYRRAT